ncbi:deoxyribodipyrimidine photo-lyase [Meinhardsimonia xiamenensis]|uniref:Deoxyribodipyrimidine photo-lyase n=1 Tax=Meinhardsimonia xiamenensis TaxID=990712 RepID=A0A1G9BBD9_9RHOB|nr:FAD-binding domain-containing protein [Meinhardsimonia xiamenensis]PRX35058.1 deoxyribodipyrimidine photo-lyase family protein (cryptochrome) [Meinhardsimonia xiamenensis]SDK36410.1 deoxyribodipyrimidine photo-lyase [Meinhardsimonia xiamenensis]
MPPRRPLLQVVWFKRDLRVCAHSPLARAAAAGPVLPLYIAEPGHWRSEDASGRHFDFLAECLAELREELAALGQPLVIRIGDAVDVLSEIHRAQGIAALWSHEETGNLWSYARDRRVAGWARARGIPWHELPQAGVVRRLPSRDGWADCWEAEMSSPLVPPPRALAPICAIAPGSLPAPVELGLAPDPCPGRQRGGRRAAEAALAAFLTDRAGRYRRGMPSPLTAPDACSRLSPHLALGPLSLREVVQATRADRARAESEGPQGWRAGLAAFEERLHWRSHFMQKLEDAPDLEARAMHPALDDLRPRTPDATRLAAWARGETGIPFLDACMRSLIATGWINFRMRAMLMAVASYHLWLDWRATGLHLARLFTDYEPGIHWPQVQMQSGVTGINALRIYNPVKQGRDHDPEGRFIRRWLPELAPIPDAFLHEPWLWPEARSVLERSYPAPIVDLAAAARAAKERMAEARRAKGFREAKAEVLARHGSRRRARRGRARRSGDRRQLALDL